MRSGAKHLQYPLEKKQTQILRSVQDDSRRDLFRSLLVLQREDNHNHHGNNEQSAQNEQGHKDLAFAGGRGSRLRHRRGCNCHGRYLRHRRLGRPRVRVWRRRLLKLRRRDLVRLWLRHPRRGRHRSLHARHGRKGRGRDRRHRDAGHGATGGLRRRGWRRPRRSPLRRSGCAPPRKLEHTHELVRLGCLRRRGWSWRGGWRRTGGRLFKRLPEKHRKLARTCAVGLRRRSGGGWSGALHSRRCGRASSGLVALN